MRGHAGLGKGVSRFGRKMESVVDSVVDGVDQWVEASIDRQQPSSSSEDEEEPRKDGEAEGGEEAAGAVGAVGTAGAGHARVRFPYLLIPTALDVLRRSACVRKALLARRRRRRRRRRRVADGRAGRGSGKSGSRAEQALTASG